MGGAIAEEPPHKAFLRERFKARCLERAVKARERAIRGKRLKSEVSSDGFDFDEGMDCDEEDEDEVDEDIMKDEVCLFSH